MPDLWMDVDTALSEVPVNILPLIDDTDFKTKEEAVAYNESGMDLVWNFVTTAGATTQTDVTPTTGGDYDWSHQGNGMYTIEIPASGGASINNDTEGFGWFTGVCDNVLPWRGPTIGFRAAAANDGLIDGGDYLQVDTVQIEGGDATNIILSSITNDSTQIDGSALNALSGVANIESLAVGADGHVEANVVEISDDGTAADDLELLVENTKGTDNKVLISTDAQDLSATLDVNTKTIEGGDASDAINAEVVDALATDTYAEPGQGAPAATASLKDKIGYLYKMFRNKLTQTATEMDLYNDAGDTVDQKSTVSDDGTTYTRGEIASGP